jgi:VanZ family protein
MKYIRFILAIIILGFIWHWSNQPGLKSEYMPIIDFFLRKGAHTLEYFILYLALFWGFLSQKFSSLSLSRIHLIHIKAFILAFLATLLDEWHQTWVLGREGKPLDLLFDSIGFLIAYILIWVIWVYIADKKHIHK